MLKVTVRQLMEAGVHFGHQKRKWNPKMERFRLMRKRGVDLIDLRETVKGIVQAKKLLAGLSAEGGEFLFVGTKLAASEAIKEAAQKCGMHYVNYRWLGGTLTNFDTVLSRIEHLRRLEEMEASGEVELMSKKEQARFRREKAKMVRNLQGIRRMTRLPSALIVVDPANEKIPVSEATRMEIPVIAIVDTDGDPDEVDIPIPANDESVHSIRLILNELVDAIMKGRAFFEEGKKGVEALEGEASTTQQSSSEQKGQNQKEGNGRQPGKEEAK
ncbi:MAG: 30S ribosomal protein S2 [Planctomycetota bacterium]|nr:MAG: 30S ribosomal protein S2 [Planctomycetota bacterium]